MTDINAIKEAIDALTCGFLDVSDIDPYMDTILGALEKRVPKKVYTTTNRFNVTHYHCPRRECHAELEYENQRCCDDCGQALDWEGFEREEENK